MTTEVCDINEYCFVFERFFLSNSVPKSAEMISPLIKQKIVYKEGPSREKLEFTTQIDILEIHNDIWIFVQREIQTDHKDARYET